MSYSWAFVGSFDVPIGRIPALEKKYRTSPSSRDPVASLERGEFLYEGGRVRHFRLCDKSEHGALRAALRALLADIAKAGGKGEGAIVGFIDGGPDDAGVRFVVEKREVSETEITTKKAGRAIQRSKLFADLVARLEGAVDTQDRAPRRGHDLAAKIRADVLDCLDRVSDKELIAGAQRLGATVRVDGTGGRRAVPLAKRYPKAAALRTALALGERARREAQLNKAPFVVLAAISPRAAVPLARRLVDSKVDPFDPTAEGAVLALAVSKDDADLSRIWRLLPGAVPQSFAASDALVRSAHRAVDGRALAELTELIGKPGAWKSLTTRATLDRAKALAELLGKRSARNARPFLEAAKRSHPQKHFFKYVRLEASKR